MNQNQRKYAFTRLNEITNKKTKQIQDAFNKIPGNLPVQIPYEVYPSTEQILLAMLGEPSTAKLKNRDDILKLIKTNYSHNHSNSVYIHQLVFCTNQKEIDRAKLANANLEERRTREVTAKVERFKIENLRLQDSIMLGSESEAMAAIAEFEALEL